MAIRPKALKKTVRPEPRGNRHERGYTNEWVKVSAIYIAQNPECVDCGLIDIRSRMVVDHIVPHRGNMTVFWNVSNWATRCQRCHNIKTGKGM